MVKNLNLGNFWTILRSNISKSHIFLKKKVSFKLKVIFGTNSGPKTKKINRAVFEKYIKVSDSGLIWRPLREYLEIKIFFQKSGCVTAVSRKKIVYFHLKKVLFVSLICTCGRFLWFWLKQNVIIMLININVILISDDLDNAEAHHSLGKSE